MWLLKRHNVCEAKTLTWSLMTHRHTPVVQVLLLLVVTSGRVVVAGRRTWTTSVRKFIIQTPERERKKERKKKDRQVLSQVIGQAGLQQILGRAHLAQPVKAELAAQHVLLYTDISLVDGLSLLASNKLSLLPSLPPSPSLMMLLPPLILDQSLIPNSQTRILQQDKNSVAVLANQRTSHCSACPK